jgi:hypothetical protein
LARSSVRRTPRGRTILFIDESGLTQKQHELPNLCARDLWSLASWAAHGLRRIRRKRQRLIVAFWKQAELWP